MITSTVWVPRGVAAELPTKIDLDEDEMARIAALAKTEFDEARLDLEDAEEEARIHGTEDADPPEMGAEDTELEEYELEKYDREERDDHWGAIADVRNLAYYRPDEKDEYLTVPEGQDADEERGELQIYPTDNLVLAAKTEDDVSYLEIYVYDDSSENSSGALYVHHDIMLPSFPLCVEWVPVRKNENENGNFAAIGTFEPEIELWDLDVVDSVYPTAILGQRPKDAAIQAKGTGKKKKKLRKANTEYHVDAVLSLSANSNHTNVLASGSADTTVKIWDLTSLSAAKSFEHPSKISSVQWNPHEVSVLASGCYDGYARVTDIRADDAAAASRKYKVSGDVEGVKWLPNGQEILVSTDQGTMYKFDARSESAPVWTLQAHDSEVTCFDVSHFVDNLMVTGSADRHIKLWNLANNSPSMLISRDLDVGKVFTTQFGPERETAGMLAVAGSEGKLKVWNAFSNKAVREAVAKDYRGPTSELVVTVEDDEEEEDEEQGLEVGDVGGDEDDEDDEDNDENASSGLSDA